MTTSVTSTRNATNRVSNAHEFQSVLPLEVVILVDDAERLAGLSIPLIGRVDNDEETGIEEGSIDSFFTLISSESCPAPVVACPLPPPAEDRDIIPPAPTLESNRRCH